jgi:hypothetical protein
MHEHGYAADAIHQRMVQLDDERGTLAIDSLDNHCLPGRKLRIESDSGHRLGQAEDVLEGCVGW